MACPITTPPPAGGRRAALLLALSSALVGAPRAALAQSLPHPAPWGLFTVRYDTHTSDFIYAVYGYGRTFAMVGALDNPRSGYTELLGAVGRNFAFGNGPTHSLALGAARTSGVWYGQLYYLPSVRVGALAVRATAEWDVPASAGGVMQFALSPLSATLVTARGIEVGGAMDLAAAHRDRTSIAAGPEIRMPLPNAVIGVDLQRFVGGQASRFRAFFTTQF
jgi:hypothetical protein